MLLRRWQSTEVLTVRTVRCVWAGCSVIEIRWLSGAMPLQFQHAQSSQMTCVFTARSAGLAQVVSSTESSAHRPQLIHTACQRLGGGSGRCSNAYLKLSCGLFSPLLVRLQGAMTAGPRYGSKTSSSARSFYQYTYM